MKATIDDPAALRAITPAALIAYALGEGWERKGQYGDHSDIYQSKDRPELILPGTDALADYASIVSDVICVLAKEECRDELQLYRDLVGADRDVVRIRTPKSLDDGSIAIDVGVDMVAQSRDLLLSAACAAKEPRAAYRAGRIKDAASYMERVRLGQTEQGSFIVTLLAPVPPELEMHGQLALWPGERTEPFDRKVTRTLVKALEASRRAAEAAVRGDGMAAFLDAIQFGVNANLCDALAILIGRGLGLEVSLTWARTRPTPEHRRVITFSDSEGEIFQEAARQFRSLEPRPDERLEAFVVALDRQPQAGEGRVTLKTFLEGQPVSIRTKLPQHLYHQAIVAHDNGHSIAVTGDLRRNGQRWVLENARDLRELSDDQVNEEQ